MHRMRKPWGWVTILPSVLENGETHDIEVEPSKQCSKHFHAEKRNLFYCIEGCIDIIIWFEGKEIVTTLRPHESYVVEAGVYHQFRTYESSARVLEQYWKTDICRNVVY